MSRPPTDYDPPTAAPSARPGPYTAPFMLAFVTAAFGLSDKIQSVGAYAGFASIVGLAVMSVLYFGQARELKRLREWAGRAPERAAEAQASQVARPGDVRRAVADPGPPRRHGVRDARGQRTRHRARRRRARSRRTRARRGPALLPSSSMTRPCPTRTDLETS